MGCVHSRADQYASKSEGSLAVTDGKATGALHLGRTVSGSQVAPIEPNSRESRSTAALKKNSGKWGPAVDKGAELIESLSTIKGTALEKLEAFTNLLVAENYVQFASMSAVSKDEQVFMVLTASGVGSEFMPKNYLFSTSSTNWSVQRVICEGTACFWASGDQSTLPDDWQCLHKTQKLASFFAVPIKVGTHVWGVLNVAMQADVEEQKHWWCLQLRLLAAVMAQHYQEVQLRKKISWLQSMAQQETIELFHLKMLQGLSDMFDGLQDLRFHLALMLPGRPCAIMFSLKHQRHKQQTDKQEQGGTAAAEEDVEVNGFMAAGTLLETALQNEQVMKVPNCRKYLPRYPSSSDVTILYKADVQAPASVMAVPLVAPDAARIGGLYVTSRTITDLGLVKRDVTDLTKLMLPLLQQKLYSELNKMLVQVSEKCRFEYPSGVSGGEDAPVVSGDSTPGSQKELVLRAHLERDVLITELQQQIRKQLAKVYKGHTQEGGANLLNDLEVYDELGRGGFGTVYRAVWKGQTAAVKIVCERESDASSLNGALELALLTSISHPNIIQIHTYFADVPLDMLPFVRTSPTSLAPRSLKQLVSKTADQKCQVLVMDFCDMGSLADVLNTSLLRLHSSRPCMKAILMCLLEVASAVQYLHSIGIVHYDLKPENVLLKSSAIDSRGFKCRVADFGLSNIVSDNSYFNKHAEGTITHLAPEAMLPDGKLTRAVDVYAFGIMMWELYTGMRPYIGYNTIDVAVKVSKEMMRPVFPSSTPAAYSSLAEQCWEGDRRTRPTVKQVIDRLHEMLKDSSLVGRESVLSLSAANVARLAMLGALGMTPQSDDTCEFPLHIL